MRENTAERTQIRDLTFRELEKRLTDLGMPRMRAVQVFSWLNDKNIDAFSRMTDLPAGTRRLLEERFSVYRLKNAKRLVSADGTEKFLWELEDKRLIESVLIKEGPRRTLCVSTQVGCRYRCPFCASGAVGFKRDLSVAEIVCQLLYARSLTEESVTNVVFMGMGEPLDNLRNVSGAIRVMNDKRGAGIGARRITVSTCGIIPGIEALSRLGLQVELSVSLHAVNDRIRDKLVPANRKYPLEDLIGACERYRESTGRMVTLEYTLIKGVNDSRKDAFSLAGIARRMNGKVNLIPCNSFDAVKYPCPDRKTMIMFRDILTSEGAKVTIRRSKGRDIMAACGQLAGRYGGPDDPGTR